MKFPSEPPACNFRNERIKFTNDSYAKIVSYWQTMIFVGLMFLGNLVVLGPIFAASLSKPSLPPLFAIILITFSILVDCFLLKGLGLIGNSRKKYLLDLKMKVFYPNGRKLTGLDTERYNTTGGISFNDIDAMHIMQKRITNRKSPYTSYALILAMRDGTSYTLLNHGNEKAVMEDAQKLSIKSGIRLVDKYKPTSTQNATSENPWSKNYKKQSQVGVFLFGGIFLAVGCIVIIAFTVRPLFNWSRSAHWMETEAVIISSELGHSRGSKGKATYRVNITFQYRINEHTYVGEKYDFFMSDLYTNIGVKAMRKAVDRHHPGDVVKCYVNPDNPKQAIISREIHCGLLILTSIFGLIFGGVGIAIILGNIKSPKK